MSDRTVERYYHLARRVLTAEGVHGSQLSIEFDPSSPTSLHRVDRAGVYVPIHELRYRLLAPARRSLHQRVQGIELSPREARLGNEVELRWERHDVPPVRSEDLVPQWYPELPFLQISEVGSWAEVAAWATGSMRPMPSSRGETLELRSSHEFERALIISRSTDALSLIEGPETGVTEVEETYEVPRE